MQNPLSKPLRSQLENTVKAARDVAEKAALAALHQLGVGDARLPEHLDESQESPAPPPARARPQPGRRQVKRTTARF
jgi:hypothetical protein